MYFIRSDERISAMIYNEVGTGHGYAKECLIQRSKYSEIDKTGGYMKLHVGLIFFAIDNRLILFLSIYVIICLLHKIHYQSYWIIR